MPADASAVQKRDLDGRRRPGDEPLVHDQSEDCLLRARLRQNNTSRISLHLACPTSEDLDGDLDTHPAGRKLTDADWRNVWLRNPNEIDIQFETLTRRKHANGFDGRVANNLLRPFILGAIVPVADSRRRVD